MSGYVSPFPAANELFGESSARQRQYLTNDLLSQQQIGGADTEMAARIAQTLVTLGDEAKAAKMYPGMIAEAQGRGFLKNAPTVWPGMERAKVVAGLGTPSKELGERAGNAETIQGLWPSASPPGPGAAATPPAVPGSGAPRPSGLAATTVEPETGLPVVTRPAAVPGTGTTLADIHPNLTTIQSPNGAKLTVSADAAPRFQGLIDDLHKAGYTLDPATTGGYNARNIAGTNTPSQHAYGSAIDINWQRNARGANTPSDIPPELARSLAAKHGLTWGGDWTGDTRDPMHFEVARGGPQAPAGGGAPPAPYQVASNAPVGPPGATSAPTAPRAPGGGGREQFTAEQAHDLDVMARQLANKPGGVAAFMTLKNHYLEKNQAAAHQAFEDRRQMVNDAAVARREQRQIEATERQIAATEAKLKQDAIEGNLKTDKQQFDKENTLRDEFGAQTATFRVTQSAYENIRSSSKIGDGASDMSMLYSYLHMIDPTTGVKEGEFKGAASSGSLGDKLQGAVNSIISGGRLSENLRQNFVREAKNLYDNSRKGHDMTADQYERLATKYGLDPERVVTRFTRPQDDAAAQYTEGQTATAADGHKLIYRNGKWGPL